MLNMAFASSLLGLVARRKVYQGYVFFGLCVEFPRFLEHPGSVQTFSVKSQKKSVIVCHRPGAF